MKVVFALLCSFFMLATAGAETAKVQATQTTSTKRSVDINLGFLASAVNLGAGFNSAESFGSLGGYFLLQTEKKGSVNQFISFGSQILMPLMDAKGFSLDLHPGAGVTLIKGGEGVSDKTVFGPSLRFGIDYKISPAGAIGIQRFETWNWFDGEAPSDVAVMTLVYKFSF